MKALRLHTASPASASGPLVCEDVEDPEPAADEIVIEVSVCGVCRTDLHIVEGELTPPSYPVTPGHQAVGRVTAVGDAVEGFETGDRVGVAWVGRFCGECRFCREGRENLCRNPVFTGFHRPGGFAERLTAAAEFVYPVPEALGNDAETAPLLCAGIIGYRSLKQSGLRPGRSVALYGFGAAAHIALQVAVAWECEAYVVSRGEETRKRALDMGAAWAGAPGDPFPRKVQHAVTFAPVGSVIPPALENLEPGGTLSVAGIYLDRIPEIDYDRHLFEERSLVSTTANTREDGRELLDLAAKHGIRADVQTFPMTAANQALHRLKKSTLEAQAAVLEIGSG